MTDRIQPDPPHPQPADQFGYGKALEELKAILAELEDPSIDIDLLGERVRRAAELIVLCRSKVRVAELQIDEIVAELAKDEAPGT